MEAFSKQVLQQFGNRRLLDVVLVGVAYQRGLIPVSLDGHHRCGCSNSNELGLAEVERPFGLVDCWPPDRSNIGGRSHPESSRLGVGGVRSSWRPGSIGA